MLVMGSNVSRAQVRTGLFFKKEVKASAFAFLKQLALPRVSSPGAKAFWFFFLKKNTLASLLLLSSCARPCPTGLARLPGTELFFGGSIPRADWADFAARTLTPAFPDGFTTYDAQGQWRAPDGRTVREGTRVVQVFGAEAARQADSVAAAYRARFHQVSVGIVGAEACAAF